MERSDSRDLYYNLARASSSSEFLFLSRSLCFHSDREYVRVCFLIQFLSFVRSSMLISFEEILNKNRGFML